jgi:adenylate kinase family enzyme
LNLQTIHLDAHFWKPGWIATAQPEWREIVSSLIDEPSWVMDGTYESTLDLRIPAADTVIVLEIPRWACLWRVLKRKATLDDRRRPDAPGGQKLDRAFLSYIWRYPAVTQLFVLDCIRKYGPDKTLIQLESSNEIQSFLRQVQRAVEQGSDRH